MTESEWEEACFFLVFRCLLAWMDSVSEKPVGCKLVLTEEDIPSASLPDDRDLKSFNVSILKRWLACRGAARSGNKPELIAR